MQLVDLATFAREPFGHSTAGNNWLRFYPTPKLAGFVLWGSPATSDVDALIHVLELAIDVQPHVTLVDVQRVVGGAPQGFARLQEYSRRQHALMGRVIERMALVRPSGMLGATAAGFFGIEEPPCPVQVFDDRTRALEWLAVPDRGFEEILDAQISEVSGTASILRDLRALLDAQPTLASIEEIARALKVSSRTLQRRLRDEKTTLSKEQTEARVRAAKRLLLASDAKLAQIALEVGCASPSHLSQLFRRVTGKTPQQWRRTKA